MRDDQGGEFLTEEEATRLWKRAAELQAEAARRAELLPAGTSPDDGAAADAKEDAPGYALEHVRQAAVEAGIDGTFVDAALADLRAERALGEGRRGRGFAYRFLGRPADAVTARRTIQASVPAVLEAMERVMPREAFGLVLRDRIGDPAEGGVMVFDIPGAGFSGAGQASFVGAASYADFRQVHATVVAVGDATEVTLRGPVAWARPLNAGIGAVIDVLGAGLGMALGSGAAAGAAAGLTALGLAAAAPWAAATLVVAGVAGGATGGHNLFRRLYRHGLSKGEAALESLLGAIAMEAEGGWGLSRLPSPTSGDDGSTST